MAPNATAADGQPTAVAPRRPARAMAAAVGTFVLWTAVTYLLEGRLRTLLRPEAAFDRVTYALVANVLVGTVLALWVTRWVVLAGHLSPERLGLRSARRTALAVVVAGALGGGLFVLQGPPSTDVVVVTNAFAQVLVVSIAEVVVCWVLLGGTVEWALSERTDQRVATVGASLLASAAFGVYHVAHSPPFNTPAMVGLLTVVGLGTSLVYFGGRTLYGALVFHNTQALFGVTQALAASGQLAAFETPQVPLLAMAGFALFVLVVAERTLVRRAASETPTAE
ncbi:hypothetical protein [Haloarcula marina]|uniref:hypothetical protein n=1 Tax=Haloarcula marina TaxID=2961574 RepID=UPI0020B6C7B9|nr:hypothetical protein [Halomicroarcula marina]